MFELDLTKQEAELLILVLNSTRNRWSFFSNQAIETLLDIMKRLEEISLGEAS